MQSPASKARCMKALAKVETSNKGNAMSENTVKLPRNKRYQDQAKATKAVVKLDVDIASATSELVKQLRKAEWFETCCMVAYRVNDCTTLPQVTAHNDVIQAGRNVAKAQRKRISAAIGSPILAGMVNAGKGCKSGAAVLKMLDGHGITSLHSLRKAIKVVKSEPEKSAELDTANETGRSELGIEDPSPDGLQGLYDICDQAGVDCASVPVEDRPIWRAGLLRTIKQVRAAGDKRNNKIEAADRKAEKLANKKAA